MFRTRRLERGGAVLVVIVAALGVGWAPAPFPKPSRLPSMAGAWDVNWVGMNVRLDLRPDGSARFAYVPGGGAWDGSWKYDPKIRQLTLTLMINPRPLHYILTFKKTEADLAEGTVQRQSPVAEPLKMVRAKQK